MLPDRLSQHQSQTEDSMKTLGKSILAVFAIIGVIASIQQLRGQSATPLEGATISHVGIIVNDIDKTVRLFEEVFGIMVPKAREVGPLTFPTDVPGSANSRVKYTMAKVENLTIELIQPISGPGPHRDHLDKFGQGLQHIAFSVKDPQGAIRYLQSKGGKRTMSSYVDLKDQLGFTAEITGMPRSAQ